MQYVHPHRVVVESPRTGNVHMRFPVVMGNTAPVDDMQGSLWLSLGAIYCLVVYCVHLIVCMHSITHQKNVQMHVPMF